LSLLRLFLKPLHCLAMSPKPNPYSVFQLQVGYLEPQNLKSLRSQ
jgi:hypothetical protein